MIEFKPVLENTKPNYELAQSKREALGFKRKKGKVIYEPSGKAAEYAKLALNMYNKCEHGCGYCFAPNCTFVSKDDYFASADPKKNIIERAKKDADWLSQYSGVPEIMLSFIGDPYQPEEVKLGLTRQIMSILIQQKLPFTILTKGGSRAVRDFDLLSAYPESRFGTSLVFTDQADADHWEPHAASIEDRIGTIQAAHAMGIKTWISLEPVIYPAQAIEIVKTLHPIVDHWKIGKINHNSSIEAQVDWAKFRNDITKVLKDQGTDFYLKKSLTEY